MPGSRDSWPSIQRPAIQQAPEFRQLGMGITEFFQKEKGIQVLQHVDHGNTEFGPSFGGTETGGFQKRRIPWVHDLIVPGEN